MIGTPLAPGSRHEALTPLGYALPQSGPVPDLMKRIVELLGVETEDFVIDLCSRGDHSSRAIPEELGGPFGERLARLVATSGVRTVQMSPLALGRFPMRYDKVLLRGGFANLRDFGRPLLARLFERLEPSARLLVVDSAPSQDAPIFADGLRRWRRQHCSARAVARVVRQAGFSTEIAVAECLRQVPAADCRAWIASRGWPILETLSDEALERGLGELRRRYAAQPVVTFTSRFEMVLGTKPERVAARA